MAPVLCGIHTLTTHLPSFKLPSFCFNYSFSIFKFTILFTSSIHQLQAIALNQFNHNVNILSLRLLRPEQTIDFKQSLLIPIHRNVDILLDISLSCSQSLSWQWIHSSLSTLDPTATTARTRMWIIPNLAPRMSQHPKLRMSRFLRLQMLPFPRCRPPLRQRKAVTWIHQQISKWDMALQPVTFTRLQD